MDAAIHEAPGDLALELSALACRLAASAATGGADQTSIPRSAPNEALALGIQGYHLAVWVEAGATSKTTGKAVPSPIAASSYEARRTVATETADGQ
jgi:hypothetical protein